MRKLPVVLIGLLVIATVWLLLTGDGSGGERGDVPPDFDYTLWDDGPPDEVPVAVAVERVARAEAPSASAEEVPPSPSRTVDLETKIERYAVADATVAEAVEEVARRIGCRVSLTDAAWKHVGPSSSIHLHLEDVSASTVLDMLTHVHGLHWEVADGTVWILAAGEEPPEGLR